MFKFTAIVTILLGILFTPAPNSDSVFKELDAANKSGAIARRRAR